MADGAFLTPTLDAREVPIGRWIELQAELLRDAAARGAQEIVALLEAGHAQSSTEMTVDQ